LFVLGYAPHLCGRSAMGLFGDDLPQPGRRRPWLSGQNSGEGGDDALAERGAAADVRGVFSEGIDLKELGTRSSSSCCSSSGSRAASSVVGGGLSLGFGGLWFAVGFDGARIDFWTGGYLGVCVAGLLAYHCLECTEGRRILESRD
jgi:hypothetical protein